MAQITDDKIMDSLETALDAAQTCFNMLSYMAPLITPLQPPEDPAEAGYSFKKDLYTYTDYCCQAASLMIEAAYSALTYYVVQHGLNKEALKHGRLADFMQDAQQDIYVLDGLAAKLTCDLKNMKKNVTDFLEHSPVIEYAQTPDYEEESNPQDLHIVRNPEEEPGNCGHFLPLPWMVEPETREKDAENTRERL